MPTAKSRNPANSLAASIAALSRAMGQDGRMDREEARRQGYVTAREYVREQAKVGVMVSLNSARDQLAKGHAAGRLERVTLTGKMEMAYRVKA